MQTPAAHAPALTATYPGDAQYIRAVRADLRTVLGDCPRAVDAILCAFELAVNAALHSHSRLSGGTFTARATVSPDHYVQMASSLAAEAFSISPSRISAQRRSTAARSSDRRIEMPVANIDEAGTGRSAAGS